MAEHHEYFANGVLVSNCDSGLYGWRFCYQYMSKPLPAKPAVGSAAWAAAQQRALFEAAARDVARHKEQHLGGDWGGGLGGDDWGAGA